MGAQSYYIPVIRRTLNSRNLSLQGASANSCPLALYLLLYGLPVASCGGKGGRGNGMELEDSLISQPHSLSLAHHLALSSFSFLTILGNR